MTVGDVSYVIVNNGTPIEFMSDSDDNGRYCKLLQKKD